MCNRLRWHIITIIKIYKKEHSAQSIAGYIEGNISVEKAIVLLKRLAEIFSDLFNDLAVTIKAVTLD